MSTLDLCRGGRRAELGLLDGAARDADEMVMVSRSAADVGRLRTGEPTNEPASAQQLNRAVDRRQTEAGSTLPRSVVHVDDREGSAPPLDRLQYGPALWRRSCTGRKRELTAGHRVMLIDTDSHFNDCRRLTHLAESLSHSSVRMLIMGRS